MAFDAKEWRKKNRKRHREYVREWLKRRRGKLCVSCNDKVVEGLTRCEKHRTQYNEYHRSLIKQKKQDGICQTCSKPRTINSVYCEKHKITHYIAATKYNNHNKLKINEKAAARKKMHVNTGRCCTCGCPYMEEGYKTCVNCRHGIHKPYFIRREC